MQKGLSSNQLKLIAMVAMTADHVGLIFFPKWVLLRLVGRLAFPIYAYMIGEGCRYTRSMPKYLGSVAAMALACQLTYWFAQGSLYQSILVTFSLSIALCMLAKQAIHKGGVLPWGMFGVGVAVALFVTRFLPVLLSGTDYAVDYGFWGVMLPVGVYLAKDKKTSLAYTAAFLALLALDFCEGQWFALAAVPFLMLYNGHRGTRDMKWLFYFFYPAHLVVLWGISFLIS